MRRREPRRGASGRVEAAVEVGTERGRGHDHGLGTDAGGGQGRGQDQETGGGLGTHKKILFTNILHRAMDVTKTSLSTSNCFSDLGIEGGRGLGRGHVTGADDRGRGHATDVGGRDRGHVIGVGGPGPGDSVR